MAQGLFNLGVLLIAGVGGLLGAACWMWLNPYRAGKEQEPGPDAQVLQGLQRDFAALCAGAAGVGERLLGLERQLRRLSERQDQLEVRSVGERPYAQAIRMVQRGASAQDLIAACGLSQGEAELVVLMHGPDHAGRLGDVHTTQ